MLDLASQMKDYKKRKEEAKKDPHDVPADQLGPNGFKKWKRVSASQIGGKEQCDRKWWFSRVQRLPEPGSIHFAIGTAYHEQAENYTKNGILPVVPFPSVKNAIKNGLIPPPHEHRYVERHVYFDKVIPGIELNGYIDLIDEVENRKDRFAPLEIWDYKTCSSWRYCETEKTLKHNVQLIIYARWGILHFDTPNGVIVGHRYLRKNSGETKEVFTTLSREYIFAKWEELLTIMQEMKDMSVLPLHHINLNKSSCSKFGGCPFAGPCKSVDYEPHKDKPNLFGGSKMTKAKTSDTPKLKDLMKERKKKKDASFDTEKYVDKLEGLKPKKQRKYFAKLKEKLSADHYGAILNAFEGEESNEESSGVSPPDAPDDETPRTGLDRLITEAISDTRTKNVLAKAGLKTLKDLSEFVDEHGESDFRHKIDGCGGKSEKIILDTLAKEAGHKAEVDSLTDDDGDDDEEPSEKPRSKTKEPSSDQYGGLTVLLVNCYPAKGLHYLLTGEDIVAKAARKIEKELGREWYALENFFEARDLICALIQRKVGSLEGRTIVLDSTTPMGAALLEVLTPIADIVVKR